MKLRNFFTSCLEWSARLVILIGGVHAGMISLIICFGLILGGRNTGSELEHIFGSYSRLMSVSNLADMTAYVSVPIFFFWFLIKIEVMDDIVRFSKTIISFLKKM